MDFALTGAAGYVAPRHMNAIKETGNNLVAALDPSDSVGIIDSYFPDCSFFTEFERFDRHLEKVKREHKGVDYVSICSPNYLHDAHCRLAMRLGADAICEKPLVLNPWNLDQLKEIELETGQKVYTVLQLRLHPSLIKLKKELQEGKKNKVSLFYITPRGKWYDNSWKGIITKSGGVATNIGIHFFDMLYWLFGNFSSYCLSIKNNRSVGGILSIDNADAEFFLSVNKEDLPDGHEGPYRSITINGEEVRFDDVFTDLHTIVYEDILSGGGFGLDDAAPSVILAHSIRQAEVHKRYYI